MKFGYFTLTDNPPAFGSKRQDANQLFLDVVEQAIASDDLGFNSVWLPEHHFGGFGIMPTPNQTLSYIAARTKRVKLAQATVLLPCNQPLRAAEEVAVLDLLSNGRAIFSAGRGYDEREYRAFEIPFAESRTRFDEELELVRTAWTKENFTWDGPHHKIPDPITLYPKVIQQPHPPVYVACFSEPTMQIAAKLGFNIIFAPFAAAMIFGSLAAAVAKFKEYSDAAGNPDAKAMCSYFTCIADTPEEERAAKERLIFYLKGIVPAFPSDMTKAPPTLHYFKEIIDRIHGMTPDQVGERSIVTGTPKRVIEQLQAIEQAGISEVICYFSYGAHPHKDVMHQMRRFSKEIMPAFSGSAREAVAAGD